MNDESLHPPKGFRKPIPLTVKGNIILKQNGRCTACGEKLNNWKEVEFNHSPPIQMRLWNAESQDTDPPSNSEDHIEAVHKDCHAVETTGKRGESKLSKRGGDVSEIAKLRRITKKTEDFRRKLLTKNEDPIQSDEQARPKKKAWPSRPFPKREKPKK